ncbi:hypothetical protein KDK95_17650 [Actinospica sp. MGRD01-02]|uniref:Uncharacterized protein n=1 Tax=Actinospica acidithermotolerans TaxID=2828514 RepID=A0A941IM18_9ACTN|nr:hypothetical protein [Actinospica acidithermotolerans]MBR7828146.1 hypothetical protein [Actinospica acidithermotolerans]
MALDVIEDSEQDLDEDVTLFTSLDRNVGWRQAYLVARRVEPVDDSVVGLGQPRARTAYRRISVHEFARRARTSDKRVRAYLRAWERAAADGIVPASASLDRETAVQLPDAAATPFYGEEGYYRGHEAYNMSEARLEAIERESESLGIRPQSCAFVAAHPKAVTAAIIADERTYKAAKKAFEEYERRQQQSDRTDREANRVALEEHLRSENQPEQDGAATGHGGREDESLEGQCSSRVLQDLGAARMSVLNALALLRKHPGALAPQQVAAITDFCETTRSALEDVRDLVATNHPDLSDAALKAFLEESETP